MESTKKGQGKKKRNRPPEGGGAAGKSPAGSAPFI